MLLEGERKEPLGSGSGCDASDLGLVGKVEDWNGDGAIECRDEGDGRRAVDGCGWAASLIRAGDGNPRFDGLMNGNGGCGDGVAGGVVDAEGDRGRGVGWVNGLAAAGEEIQLPLTGIDRDDGEVGADGGRPGAGLCGGLCVGSEGSYGDGGLGGGGCVCCGGSRREGDGTVHCLPLDWKAGGGGGVIGEGGV